MSGATVKTGMAACERCGHELARDPGAWGFWVSAPGEPRAGSDRGSCPDTDRRHVPGVAR
jgi:hypothetical protein